MSFQLESSLPCENCGAQALSTPKFRSSSDTLSCAACGAWAFTGPIDVPVQELYDESYFSGGEYFSYAASSYVHRLNFRRKLKLLQRCGLERTARILEIGSATGEFLGIAREAGAQVLGIEPSAFGRDAANRRGLTTLAHDDPERLARVRDFRPTAIVGWDVWEHLQRPAHVLDEILEVAAPDALVAFSTVDASSAVARRRGASWRQYHPPTHLNYPTRESFRRLFSGRNIRILHHRSFGYYRPLAEYVRAVLPDKHHHHLPQSGPVWMLPVYLNLYDTQLVVGRRG